MYRSVFFVYLLIPTWTGPPALAQNAVRDLPDFYQGGRPLSVTITLTPPSGTAVVGVEDAPPVGWSVSGVTEGGAFDAASGKVKWGPYFGGSVPAALAYSLRPPQGSFAVGCLVGAASFDGLDQSISGDLCVALAVPTLSAAGSTVLVGLLLIGGYRVLAKRASENLRLDRTRRLE